MDTFTQALLGCAVAETVAGKQLGRRASLWGGALGILPDLDIFVRYVNPVDSFTLHRSFSHSLLIFVLLTPLLLWLAGRIHGHSPQLRLRWAWMIFLCLATHVLLDSLTIYGTQLFWPISEYPYGMGSVFIIDPVYSLLLLVGCMAVLISRASAGRWLLLGSFGLATAYLLWGLFAQQIVIRQLNQHISGMDAQVQQLVVTPAPFNSVLWRFVLRVEGGYHEGFISILDEPGTLDMQFHDSADEWIETLEKFPSASRLMWFTKGAYAIHRPDEELIITDLRMGITPDFPFTFKVAELSNGVVTETMPVRYNRRNVTREKLNSMWERIKGNR